MKIRMILVLVLIALSGCASNTSNLTQNELDDIEYDVEETLRIADKDYMKRAARCKGMMVIKIPGTRIKKKYKYTASELNLAQCKKRRLN